MRIGLLIDLPQSARYHEATVDALRHAAEPTGRSLSIDVIHTDAADLDERVARSDGLVIGPGSPYRDELAVWRTIAGARERGVPLVGT